MELTGCTGTNNKDPNVKSFRHYKELDRKGIVSDWRFIRNGQGDYI